MQEVADAMSRVAKAVAVALAGSLMQGRRQAAEAFPAGCDETTCFLRLNRYPACPFAPDTFGLVPHTDSDFLTVLCQDQVGGLQLMKDARWVAVKPHPDALIVNIGDLFQVTVRRLPPPAAGRCIMLLLPVPTWRRAPVLTRHRYQLRLMS